MARRVIALLGQPVCNEDGVADEAITPGHLVSGVTTLVKHASAGGAAARTFALERDELGNDIDTAYASGDTVKVGSFAPGQRVLAWVPSGHGIAIDTFLESAGTGQLRAFGSGVRVARSLEAVAGGVTTAQRIRCEVY